ncbi:hypothetical protein C8R45DRAFT_1101580 [Mycena sanguinolenta]|nr:hypothetical protein C8R45DRAFT_1101580 [Mycena sanguinolenta]
MPEAVFPRPGLPNFNIMVAGFLGFACFTEPQKKKDYGPHPKLIIPVYNEEHEAVEDKDDVEQVEASVFPQPAIVTGARMRDYQVEGLQRIVGLNQQRDLGGRDGSRQVSSSPSSAPSSSLLLIASLLFGAFPSLAPSCPPAPLPAPHPAPSSLPLGKYSAIITYQQTLRTIAFTAPAHEVPSTPALPRRLLTGRAA